MNKIKVKLESSSYISIDPDFEGYWDDTYATFTDEEGAEITEAPCLIGLDNLKADIDIHGEIYKEHDEFLLQEKEILDRLEKEKFVVARVVNTFCDVYINKDRFKQKDAEEMIAFLLNHKYGYTDFDFEWVVEEGDEEFRIIKT